MEEENNMFDFDYYIEIQKKIIKANLKRKVYRTLEQILIIMVEEGNDYVILVQNKLAEKLKLDPSDISKALKELNEKNILLKIKGEYVDCLKLVNCKNWKI